MSICDRCKNKCKIDVIKIKSCINFVGEAPHEIVTNFDRITESPEALAELMNDCADCNNCPITEKSVCKYNYENCKEAWLEWLKQESKE